MNQKLQIHSVFVHPLYVTPPHTAHAVLYVSRGDKMYRFCLVCPQHFISSIPVCSENPPPRYSQGFIRPQLFFRWPTALLAVFLLTPQLAFLYLSPTILKTAQGCRDELDCNVPASNPTSDVVAEVADQKLILYSGA